MAERAHTVRAMGGSLMLRVAYPLTIGDPLTVDAPATRRRIADDLAQVARRVDRWSARLTRFSTESDLSALNADPTRSMVTVRPTLAAVLAWAERATDLSRSVDVTLLDERLAAGSGVPLAPGYPPPVDRPRWHLVRRPRGGHVVRHEPFRFDLDGIAKGWIADRALGLLRDYPAVLVDADGDLAMRLSEGLTWEIAIADPRGDDHDDLGVLRLDGLPGGLVGVATSGTSVHRWATGDDGQPRHHLLDPRTRRPCRTDIVQATVIAGSARAAEVLAKSAVIAGSDAAVVMLDRPGVLGAVLLLESGEVIAPPQTMEWLT